MLWSVGWPGRPRGETRKVNEDGEAPLNRAVRHDQASTAVSGASLVIMIWYQQID